MSDIENTEPDIDPPPFFKTWGGMHRLVIGTLLVLIILFYTFSNYFE